jgi:hypothetical protein
VLRRPRLGIGEAEKTRSLAAEIATLAAAIDPAATLGLGEPAAGETASSNTPIRAARRRCRWTAIFRRCAAVPGAHFLRIRAARESILPGLGIAALASAM